MSYHIEFADHSNPYISFSGEDIHKWLKYYELEPVTHAAPYDYVGFVATFRRSKLRTYSDMKDAARNLAIDWQSDVASVTMSYQTLADWQQVFSDLGRRYGLMREFRDNGIC